MDTQKMMEGFINAKTYEDRLKELGSDSLPKNFTMMQAFLASMSDNPFFANMLLANEFKKHVPEESKEAKKKLAAKDFEIAKLETGIKRILYVATNELGDNDNLDDAKIQQLVDALPPKYQNLTAPDVKPDLNAITNPLIRSS